MPALAHLHNIAALRRAARARLPGPIFDYLDGGAEDELSLSAASADFDACRFVPTVLTDVTTITRTARLFGRTVPAPFMLSPTGLSGLYHPAGERAVARAAASRGLPYALSTLGTWSVEDVAGAATGPNLLQIYVFRDRGITADLIARAKGAGYDGLIVTVDTPMGGKRERDIANGLTMPPRLTARSLARFAARPRWSLSALRGADRFRFGNLSHHADGQSVGAFVNAQFDRALTWTDIEWVAARWNGPLAVKGILRGEDARAAVRSGADTVIVSNHGGRQLDGAVSAFSALGPIADALAGSATIICDGGIRRGAHIVKALAAGADACAIGRPYLYGLAAGGEAGVRRAIDILCEELDRCLSLLGVPRIADLDQTCLAPPNHREIP